MTSCTCVPGTQSWTDWSTSPWLPTLLPDRCAAVAAGWGGAGLSCGTAHRRKVSPWDLALLWISVSAFDPGCLLFSESCLHTMASEVPWVPPPSLASFSLALPLWVIAFCLFGSSGCVCPCLSLCPVSCHCRSVLESFFVCPRFVFLSVSMPPFPVCS